MAPVAAAVLPHPPLLVPGLAGTAAPELDPLRAACREALATVIAAADLIILIGDGQVWATPAPAAPGSFHPYGADLEVTLPTLVDLDLPGLPAPAQLTDLPLSLAIAAHLLNDADPPPAQLFAATVPRSLGPRAAATIGRALASAASRSGRPHTSAYRSGRTDASVSRIGLVAMADLSACRTERAPAAFRPEAADFDASVAAAFRTGTPQRLLALDPTRSADLHVAGRVPLQVLAGSFEPDPMHAGERDEPGSAVRGEVPEEPGSALRGAAPGEGGPARGGGRPRATATDAGDEVVNGSAAPVRGRVLYEDAPYGVGYLVALLTTPSTKPMTTP